MTAYNQSKLANVMFTYALARRLEGSGVTVNALHPGGVATGFGMNNRGLALLGMRLFHAVGIPPAQGALTSIHLASSPAVEGISGRYWNRRTVVTSSAASLNEADQERLWTLSEQMAAP